MNLIYMSCNIEESRVSVNSGDTITLLTTEPTNKPSDGKEYIFKGYSLTENGEVITTYTIPDDITEDITLHAVWEEKNLSIIDKVPTDITESDPNDSYLNVLKKIADAFWSKNGKDNYVNKADNRLDALIEIKEAIRGKNIEDITSEEEVKEYLKNQPKTILQGLIAILNAITETEDNFNEVNYPEDYAPEIPVKFSLYDALIDGEAFKDTENQKNIRIFNDGSILGTLIKRSASTEEPETEEGYVITIDTSNLDESISTVKAFMLNAHEQKTTYSEGSIEVFIHKNEEVVKKINRDKLYIIAYDENGIMLDSITFNLRLMTLTIPEGEHAK